MKKIWPLLLLLLLLLLFCVWRHPLKDRFVQFEMTHSQTKNDLSGHFGTMEQSIRLQKAFLKSRGAKSGLHTVLEDGLLDRGGVQLAERVIPLVLTEYSVAKITYRENLFSLQGKAHSRQALERAEKLLSDAGIPVKNTSTLDEAYIAEKNRLAAVKAAKARAARVALEKRKAEEMARLAEERRKAVEAEKARKIAQQKAAEAKRQAEEAERLRLAAQKKAAEAEAKRLAEERRKAAEAERLRKIAQEKALEEQRKAAEAARLAEEQRKAAEAERLRKIAQEKALEEQRKAAEAAQKAAEAEKIRLAEEKNRSEALMKRALEKQRKEVESRRREEAQKSILSLLENEIIEFETGKSTLTVRGEATVDKLVLILNQFPHIHIEIGGHTDSDGDAKFNQKLSQYRVDAVKQELVKQGVSPERMVARGYGESRPLVPNTTAENKQRNRRVEITVIGE